MAWLTGDFTGSGKTEIAQPWDNNGRLGLIVTAPTPAATWQPSSGPVTWDKDPGALGLADRGLHRLRERPKIAQPWDNNGAPRADRCTAPTPVETLTILFGSGDMGQGARGLSALGLTGDFTGSGKTEIAQPWDNNGRLGLHRVRRRRRRQPGNHLRVR